MKKTVIRFMAALLLTVMAAGLCGCNYEAIIDNSMQEIAHMLTDPSDMVEPFIGFAAEDVDRTDLLQQLKPEELQDYVPEYSCYNTYTYFDSLNHSEKMVYHAYEYALDRGLPYIWIDERLIQDIQWTAFDILQFLALDSAMVEQNVGQSRSTYTVTHSILNVETASEAYTVVYVENFSQDKMQRKQEAVKKARQIISQLPQGLTDRQKAEYFFDYLGENVTYETDIEGEEYLYTALCLGRTNCDGYTNAFALLCSLSGIPCIEINSDTPEGEEGHTWNAVYLEDKWVNVDATGAVDDVTSNCANCRQERVYFGFSDPLLTDRVLYETFIPRCPEGLSPVLNIPSGEVEDFTAKIKAAFKENDNQFAVILVDEGDLEDQITEDLATKLGFDLYYTYYETVEGKTVYYLFNDEN